MMCRKAGQIILPLKRLESVASDLCSPPQNELPNKKNSQQKSGHKITKQ